MSGPKGGGYAVDPAVLRAQREREAALARYEAALRRRTGVVSKIEARERRGLSRVAVSFREGFSDVALASTHEVQQWVAAADREIETTEAAIRTLEQVDRAATLAEQLETLDGDPAVAEMRRRAAPGAASRVRGPGDGVEETSSAGQDSASPAGVSDEEDDVQARAALIDLIEHLVAGLDPRATDAEQAEIGDIARRLVSSVARLGRADRSVELVNLRSRAQQVAVSCQRRAEERGRAEELACTLDGLAGSEIVWARGLLERCIAGEAELVTSDIDRIALIRARAEADAERRYVADQLVQAFQAEGCVVTRGFVTDVLAGRPAYAAIGVSADHAVEVELDDRSFAMRVVRAHGPSDPQRDEAAELGFCKALGDISAELHGRGVQLKLVRHEPVGAVPVERVEEAGRALARASRGQRGPIERERPR